MFMMERSSVSESKMRNTFTTDMLTSLPKNRKHGFIDAATDDTATVLAENMNNIAERSQTLNLHLKRVVTELVQETTCMETKMLEASKYYYLISNIIFFPSIMINTFIAAMVLAIDCQLPYQHCVLVNGVLDDSCMERLQIDGNEKYIAVHYVLAALAFINAILVGAQKAVRPAENGEMFQVMARKWGAFLRQMVAYKHTLIAANYSTRKVKLFVTQFNLLVENSPLLPRWLLQSTAPKGNTSYRLGNVPEANARSYSAMKIASFISKKPRDIRRFQYASNV